MIRLPGPPRPSRQLRARPPKNEYGKVRDRDHGKPVDPLEYLGRMLAGAL